MNKILKSKLFVIIVPIIVLAIGVGAGIFLGYQPVVSGTVSGTQWGSSGRTGTKYVFRIETAVGYWMLALIFAITVLFICILIRKLYLNSTPSVANDDENNN